MNKYPLITKMLSEFKFKTQEDYRNTLALFITAVKHKHNYRFNGKKPAGLITGEVCSGKTTLSNLVGIISTDTGNTILPASLLDDPILDTGLFHLIESQKSVYTFEETTRSRKIESSRLEKLMTSQILSLVCYENSNRSGCEHPDCRSMGKALMALDDLENLAFKRGGIDGILS